MPVDYGTDTQALDDLLDPGQLVSGEANLAQAIAHRWMTPAGTMALIGDHAPYDCFDVREYLGARYPLGNQSALLDEIQATAAQTALGDERVLSIQVTATLAQGALTLSGQVQGTNGPFSMVLSLRAGAQPLLSVNGVLAAVG